MTNPDMTNPDAPPPTVASSLTPLVPQPIDLGDLKTLLATLKFDANGLLPVIVQDQTSHEVLMFAYVNHDSLQRSLVLGEMVYFSRSRNRLWHKGEESGHRQPLHALFSDCDGDVLLARVSQIGGIACHTGRVSCFYQAWQNTTANAPAHWQTVLPAIKSPEQIYAKSTDNPPKPA